MTKIKNQTVLITGGASGLGKLLAQRCLEEKAYKVVLWDINGEQLRLCAEEFDEMGYEVETYVVDVSSVEDVKRNAKAVLLDVGPVDILFNNAGIVVGKPFHEHTHADITRTIDINVSALMHVALEFLPFMIEHEQGHIINIASAAGLIANPNMSVYAGSKWAVIGWSESLRLELEEKGPNLHVTTVMPSYINTGMFDGVKAPILTPIMEPKYIVDQIIKAVKNNTIILQEPFMVRSIPVLRGILPTRAFDFLARQLGVYSSMDHFVGHDKPKAEKTSKTKETTRV